MPFVKGTVKWWDDIRTFGYITQDAGIDDIYCDWYSVAPDGCSRHLADGQRVEFELVDTPDGPTAMNVRRLFDETGALATVLCGDAVQVRFLTWGRPDLGVVAERVGPFGEVRANKHIVRLRAPPYEMTVFDDGRAIVKGTDDPVLGQDLVKKWIGQVPSRIEDPEEQEQIH